MPPSRIPHGTDVAIAAAANATSAQSIDPHGPLERPELSSGHDVVRRPPPKEGGAKRHLSLDPLSLWLRASQWEESLDSSLEIPSQSSPSGQLQQIEVVHPHASIAAPARRRPTNAVATPMMQGLQLVREAVATMIQKAPGFGSPHDASRLLRGWPELGKIAERLEKQVAGSRPPVRLWVEPRAQALALALAPVSEFLARHHAGRAPTPASDGLLDRACRAPSDAAAALELGKLRLALRHERLAAKDQNDKVSLHIAEGLVAMSELSLQWTSLPKQSVADAKARMTRHADQVSAAVHKDRLDDWVTTGATMLQLQRDLTAILHGVQAEIQYQRLHPLILRGESMDIGDPAALASERIGALAIDPARLRGVVLDIGNHVEPHNIDSLIHDLGLVPEFEMMNGAIASLKRIAGLVSAPEASNRITPLSVPAMSHSVWRDETFWTMSAQLAEPVREALHRLTPHRLSRMAPLTHAAAREFAMAVTGLLETSAQVIRQEVGELFVALRFLHLDSASPSNDAAAQDPRVQSIPLIGNALASRALRQDLPIGTDDALHSAVVHARRLTLYRLAADALRAKLLDGSSTPGMILEEAPVLTRHFDRLGTLVGTCLPLSDPHADASLAPLVNVLANGPRTAATQTLAARRARPMPHLQLQPPSATFQSALVKTPRLIRTPHSATSSEAEDQASHASGRMRTSRSSIRHSRASTHGAGAADTPPVPSVPSTPYRLDATPDEIGRQRAMSIHSGTTGTPDVPAMSSKGAVRNADGEATTDSVHLQNARKRQRDVLRATCKTMVLRPWILASNVRTVYQSVKMAKKNVKLLAQDGAVAAGKAPALPQPSIVKTLDSLQDALGDFEKMLQRPATGMARLLLDAPTIALPLQKPEGIEGDAIFKNFALEVENLESLLTPRAHWAQLYANHAEPMMDEFIRFAAEISQDSATRASNQLNRHVAFLRELKIPPEAPPSAEELDAVPSAEECEALHANITAFFEGLVADIVPGHRAWLEDAFLSLMVLHFGQEARIDGTEPLYKLWSKMSHAPTEGEFDVVRLLNARLEDPALKSSLAFIASQRPQSSLRFQAIVEPEPLQHVSAAVETISRPNVSDEEADRWVQETLEGRMATSSRMAQVDRSISDSLRGACRSEMAMRQYDNDPDFKEHNDALRRLRDQAIQELMTDRARRFRKCPEGIRGDLRKLIKPNKTRDAVRPPEQWPALEKYLEESGAYLRNLRATLPADLVARGGDALMSNKLFGYTTNVWPE